MNTLFKNSLLLTMLFISTSSINAQDFKKFKIAFKLNPNIGWMVPQENNIESAGSSLRFGYGVDVDFMFTENYALGTGLKIENSGGKLNYLAVDVVDDTRYIIDRERDYNLKYVEVPMTLKLRTNEIGYITYYGQFGLGLGINVSAKADDTNDFIYEFSEPLDSEVTVWHETDFETNKETKVNVSDDANLFRTSLIVGAGIEYNLQGATSIIAGVTFNNGFSNVLSGKAVDTDSNGIPVFENIADENGVAQNKMKVNNNFISINIGILF